MPDDVTYTTVATKKTRGPKRPLTAIIAVFNADGSPCTTAVTAKLVEASRDGRFSFDTLQNAAGNHVKVELP